MAMHLNSDNFNQVISKGKVMVDFWAPWCMPCQSLLPVIDELSGELEGKAVVAKVNVDENKPIAREYGVMSIQPLSSLWMAWKRKDWSVYSQNRPISTSSTTSKKIYRI